MSAAAWQALVAACQAAGECYHSNGEDPSTVLAGRESEPPTFAMPLYAFDQFEVSRKGTEPDLSGDLESVGMRVGAQFMRGFAVQLEVLEADEGQAYVAALKKAVIRRWRWEKSSNQHKSRGWSRLVAVGRGWSRLVVVGCGWLWLIVVDGLPRTTMHRTFWEQFWFLRQACGGLRNPKLNDVGWCSLTRKLVCHGVLDGILAPCSSLAQVPSSHFPIDLRGFPSRAFPTGYQDHQGRLSFDGWFEVNVFKDLRLLPASE
eukprot:Skav230429  [mRNA]  locus=scaffold1601:105166:106749:+ [translate_table: standard]